MPVEVGVYWRTVVVEAGFGYYRRYFFGYFGYYCFDYFDGYSRVGRLFE